MKKLIYILLIVFTLALATPALAKTVTMSWNYDTNQEASITEFDIHQSNTSGQYDLMAAPVATATPDERTVSFTIPDTDATYYWVMTAYNATYGTRSGPSNEVSITIQGGQVIFPSSPSTPQVAAVRVTD